MKRTSLVLAGLAVICATPAFADNTDSATVSVSGTIVNSLEITQDTAAITMPYLVKRGASDTADTSVRLTCDQASDASNLVEYFNGGNPFANGVSATIQPTAGANVTANGTLTGVQARGACATLNVTGDTTYSFITNLAITQATAGTGITLSAPTCKTDNNTVVTSGTSVALASGARTLRCGATITAAANAAATYSAGEFTVTVTYD